MAAPLRALALVALALLASPATASAPTGTTVLVFVDFSASIHGAERVGYQRELERDVLPWLAPGDRIVIASIDDRTLTSFRPLAEATLPVTPPFNGWVDNVLKYRKQVKAVEENVAQARAQLQLDVKEAFAKPLASPYTDIFSSVLLAQKLFDGDTRHKVLVLMSDMIEDYPPHKFDAMTWRAESTKKLLDELQLKRQIADLSGVCVYVSGASAPRAELARDIGRFWEEFFRRAHADFDQSRYSHVLLHWPPTKGCRRSA
ncbi:MAG TPA: hypothetical protein VHZ49_19745 [Methylomirabilota bacterium]|jgi:hypothetical protein|nr:hypothetical protein [Methylomirabilota bacterium]